MPETKSDPSANHSVEERWNEAQALLDEVVRNALRPWKRHHLVDDVNRFKQRLSEKLLEDDKKLLRNFRQEAELKTWLQKIAKREVNRALLRESRSVSFDDAPPEAFEQKPKQEELLLRKEQRNLMKEMLPKLPPRKRKLAELVLRGLTDEEIAREMGLKVETVYKRKSEALKKLQELVEEQQKGFRGTGRFWVEMAL